MPYFASNAFRHPRCEHQIVGGVPGDLALFLRRIDQFRRQHRRFRRRGPGGSGRSAKPAVAVRMARRLIGMTISRFVMDCSVRSEGAAMGWRQGQPDPFAHRGAGVGRCQDLQFRSGIQRDDVMPLRPQIHHTFHHSLDFSRPLSGTGAPSAMRCGRIETMALPSAGKSPVSHVRQQPVAIGVPRHPRGGRAECWCCR